MKLSKKIKLFLEWIDDEDGRSEKPEWMGGSEWFDCNGTSEAWEFVLLREAEDEIAKLEAELAKQESMAMMAVYILQQAQEELIAVLEVAKARGEQLGYEDLEYWERLETLKGGE
jgi:hypothetical protein